MRMFRGADPALSGERETENTKRLRRSRFILLVK
jgi:hypothetical protein